jgi:adenine-specific DNA-methyltransferase
MPKGAGRPPRASAKRKIEHYTHVGKDRANNPPVGLVTPETDRDAANKPYTYDPHIDPALQWAGKAERTSFEIPTVSLHVHERIDPRSIIEAVRKKNGEDFVQGSLFSRLDENPPIREAIEFYKHKHNRVRGRSPRSSWLGSGPRSASPLLIISTMNTAEM